MKAYAAFSDPACGARASAMGGAFTAIAGGAEAMCSNPASMLELSSPELTAVYGRLYSGLSDDSRIGQGYFGFAAPVKRYLRGAAGLSWNETRLSEAFSETSYSVSYATAVYRGIGAGLTLKYLRRGYVADGYTSSDPVFTEGYSKGALGADLGFFYRPSSGYALGLSVRNLNRPDLGLAAADRQPVEVRAGASYAMKAGLVDLDAAFAGRDHVLSAGAEYSFQKRYALRMGLAAGNGARRNANLGFGGRFGPASFDYAFSLPLGGISGTMGSHRLAFSFRLGTEAEARPAAPAAGKASLQEEKTRVLQKTPDPAGRQGAVAPQPAQADSAGQIEALKLELEKARTEMENARLRAEKNRTKPQRPAGRRTYVVKEGDTLASVAAEFYGDPERWPEIYRANAGSLGRGGEVKPGQVLTLP